MGWIQDMNKARLYKYEMRKEGVEKSKTITGTTKDLEVVFCRVILAEPNETVAIEEGDFAGWVAEYKGFLPIRCPGMGRVGGSGSDRQIASMKKSFRKRFVTHELDDLRHKFGTEIDASLRAGEIRRSENALAGITDED